jgi:hypothetical protein
MSVDAAATRATPPAPRPQVTEDSPRARSVRRDGLASAFFAVVAIVFTFPVRPSRYGKALPGDSGDALLNLWILHWVGHRLGSGWSGLWNTSMFFPHENTLAYSESMFPVAILHRVLSALVGSDVLAFNLIYVGAWTLSGWVTYLLARRLSGSTAGALVAGVVYTIASPRLSQYAHFQLAMGFLVPLVLLLVLRFFEMPGIGRGALLGFTTGVLALSTSYYGLMTLVALAVLVPTLAWWTWQARTARRVVLGLGTAAVAGAVIVVPVAWQYQGLRADPHFRRDPEPAQFAHLGDFLRVTPRNYVVARVPPFENRSRAEAATIENRLYPGLPAVAFGTIGLVALIRRRRAVLAAGSVSGRMFVLLVPTALLLMLLAFGDRLAVRDRTFWMPYSALRDLPGFGSIRSTARFVAFPLLVLALLAALGVSAVLTRCKGAGARTVLAGIVLVAIGVESAMAIELAETPRDAASRAVNEALAQRPAGAVLELPVGSPADGWPWGYIETPRQYLSTIDGHPRIGGYSGYAPPHFDALAATFETFPSRSALALADRLRVRYVVLRTGVPNGLTRFQVQTVARDGVGVYNDAHARAIVAHIPKDRVRHIDRYGQAWLIELTAPR